MANLNQGTGRKMIAQNRKARHDYHIDDTLEAGLVLQGTEVKSLRAGRATLVDGFGEIHNGEAFLHGVHIPEYTEGTWTNHEPRRAAQDAAQSHRDRQMGAQGKRAQHTIVPLALYFKDGRESRDRLVRQEDLPRQAPVFGCQAG